MKFHISSSRQIPWLRLIVGITCIVTISTVADSYISSVLPYLGNDVLTIGTAVLSGIYTSFTIIKS